MFYLWFLVSVRVRVRKIGMFLRSVIACEYRRLLSLLNSDYFDSFFTEMWMLIE